MDLRFRSDNRTDVDRVSVTKADWEALKDELRREMIGNG